MSALHLSILRPCIVWSGYSWSRLGLRPGGFEPPGSKTEPFAEEVSVTFATDPVKLRLGETAEIPTNGIPQAAAVWSIYSRRNRGLRHPAKLWLSVRYERRGLNN